jgi:Ca-activated chloride channel family protein
MFNPNAYENTRPGGLSALEIVDERARFVPLKRTELHGEIAGPLASLRLVQVFGYTREQSDRTLAAIYRFPLPGDAAVTGVTVRFGEVEIQATLAEREEAEAEYQEAQQQGHQAALLTRETPDVFSLRVSGLIPDQQITVETTYVQLARAEDAGWSIRVPLTTAPRYVRDDETGSRAAEGQPLLLLRDPGHLFTLDLTVQDAGTVRSTTHALDITEEGVGVRVRLRDGHVMPDRDFVLTWQPAQERRTAALRVWAHDDPASEHRYFLATVAPPALEPEQEIAREVILLVDHSGSMEGPKWTAADWAVKRFLSGLTERDSFNLGLFHNTVAWFAERPRAARPDAVAQATRFLDEQRDSGGTNLGVALEQALRMSRAAGAPSRHVLVITDAEVTDEGRILRLADDEWSRNADHRRISVLCIDAAPNSFLAVELAERGGGVARFLTSSPDEEDITTALDAVLADWTQPVHADLQLVVNRAPVQAGGRHVRSRDGASSAIDLGDLPAGRTLWVVGRTAGEGAGDLSFRLAAGDDPSIASRGATAGMPALKALFGARQVLGLEYLMHAGYSLDDLAEGLRRLGYDPDRVLGGRQEKPPAVYAENARVEQRALLKGLLAREALAYGLASSETAFVAVRREQGHVIEGTVPVANALPAGWSDRFLTAGAPPIAARSMHALHSPGPLLAAAPDMIYESFPSGVRSPDKGALDQLVRNLRAQGYFAEGNQPPAQAAPHAPATMDALDSTFTEIFSGTPQRADSGEFVLFDTDREGDRRLLPAGDITCAGVRVRFLDGAPDWQSLDSRLCLLLFAGDMAAPRARVRLLDITRQGGERPLNIAVRAGERIRLVLDDPAGAWARQAARIAVTLSWQA